MSINKSLNAILKTSTYQFNELSDTLQGLVGSEDSYYFYECRHKLNSPITENEKLDLLQIIDIPKQICDLLQISNGAELFIVQHQSGIQQWEASLYRIFNNEEIVAAHQEMLDMYLAFSEEDEEDCHVRELDYVAFGMQANGYLAIHLESNLVFALTGAATFYPYSAEFTNEYYIPVANSLDQWLLQLAERKGEIFPLYL